MFGLGVSCLLELLGCLVDRDNIVLVVHRDGLQFRVVDLLLLSAILLEPE